MAHRFWSFAVIVVLTGTVLGAQVRVDVRLVNVIATVMDDRGRYISHLAADDFLVEEDGRSQKIVHFSQDQDTPVSIGIVLDTSGSMERKLRTAIDAVERFAEQLRKDDEIFVITFSSRPVLRQDFTTDRTRLHQSLRRLLATGGTALYDALDEGLRKVRDGTHVKRAILVVTDGQDTGSFRKLDDVVQTIRESELLVYSLGISPPVYTQRNSTRRDEVDLKVLRTLAESSGGSAFLVSQGPMGPNTQLNRVLDTIANELRSQYTLGYYPERADDGRYHRIRVRARAGYDVRARRGYTASGSLPSTSVDIP
ncbi:MAG TPA: VWA domain-containing protein [Terriglobia bacterium]|nr:VWA domain-containing protein [Terriglobia bacterium]